MWSGEVTMRPSAITLYGSIGTAGLHAYHWGQVLMARKGEMILANAAGKMATCRTAVILPGVHHAIVRGTTDGSIIVFPAESAGGCELARSPSPPDSPEAWARAGLRSPIDSTTSSSGPNTCHFPHRRRQSRHGTPPSK